MQEEIKANLYTAPVDPKVSNMATNMGINDLVDNVRVTSVQKLPEASAQSLLDSPNTSQDLKDAIAPTFAATTFMKPSLKDATENKISLVERIVPEDEIYTELSDGSKIATFKNYKPFSNNEERLARQQSGFEQLLNGAIKMTVKGATYILDGTVGEVNGLVQGGSQGTLDAVYNNAFGDWVDDVGKKLDASLPNYYTQHERDMSLLRQMGTANFLANDFMGGAAFLVGTIGSEMIWAAATGGSSLVARGMVGGMKTLGKMSAKGVFKGMGKSAAKATAKKLRPLVRKYLNTVNKSKLGRAINNTRFLYTSAGYESGVEGRHFFNDTVDKYITDYKAANGTMPSAEELTSVISEAAERSNYVFGTNLALVGASNVAQFGTIFTIAPKITSKVSRFKRGLFTGGFEVAKDGTRSLKGANAFRRKTGDAWHFFEPMLVEGVWEEGMQGVISGANEKYVLSQFDKNAFDANYSMIDGVIDSLEEQYSTKEGFKEIIVGMLIGKAGQVVSEGFGGAFTVKNTQRQTEVLKKQVERSNELNAEIKLLQPKVNSTKTEEELEDSLTPAEITTLNNLKKANQYVTYRNAAQQSAENGDFNNAATELQRAMLAKFKIDSAMGGVELAMNDFNTTLDNIQPDNLKELGVEESDIDAYKESLREFYMNSYQTFKDVQDTLDTMDFKRIAKKTGRKKSEAALIREEIESNLYLGVTANTRAKEQAEALNEVLGSGSRAGTALSIYTKLGAAKRKKLSRLHQLNAERTALDKELNQLTEGFTATPITRNQDAENQTNEVNALVEKRMKLQERISEVEQETIRLKNELSNKLDRRTGVLAVEAFTDESIGDFGVDELVDSLEKLENLHTTLKSEDPIQAQELGQMMYDLQEQLTMSKMFMEEVTRLQETGNFRAAAELYAKYNLDVAKEDSNAVFEAFMQGGTFTGDVEFTLRAMRDLETRYKKFDEAKAQNASLQITRQREQAEPITLAKYKDFIETGWIDLSAKAQIVAKKRNNMPLSPREQAMYDRNTQEFLEAIALENLRQGAALTALITAPVDPIEPTGVGVVDEINQKIDELRQANLSLKKTSPTAFTEENEVTQEDFDRLDLLAQRRINITRQLNNPRVGKRRAADLESQLESTEQEAEDIKKKIDEWGRFQGVVDNETGMNIGELIILRAELEATISNATPTESITTNPLESHEAAYQDDSDVNLQSPTSTGTKRANLGILQTYDTVVVSSEKGADDTRSLVIHNMSLQALVDTLAPVAESSGTSSPSKVHFTIDGHTMEFERNSRGRIKTTNSQETLEALAKAGLYVTKLDGSRKPYTVLLRKAGDKLIPVKSDFKLAEGFEMDTQAMQGLRPNQEVKFVVSLDEAYNKGEEGGTDLEKLRKSKNKKDELKAAQDLVIYAVVDGNKVVGVVKSGTGEDSVMTQEDLEIQEELLKLRQHALDKLYKTKGRKITLDYKAPVSRVYVGQPVFDISLEGGEAKLNKTKLSSRTRSKVSDVGFVEGGEVTYLNNKTLKDNVSLSFMVKAIKKQRRTGASGRIPFAVIEINGTKVAYPVTVSTTQSGTDAKTAAESLWNTYGQTDKASFLKGYYELLNEYGLDPNNPNLQFTFTKAVDFNELEGVYPPDSNPNIWEIQDMETILNSLEFDIDVNNDPFQSPKVVLDFMAMNTKKPKGNVGKITPPEAPTAAPTEAPTASTTEARGGQSIDEVIAEVSQLPFEERVGALMEKGVIASNMTYQMGRRFPLIININGVKIPFYRSSGGTSGKQQGSWFPFFGFGTNQGNDWLVKGTLEHINSNYDSPVLGEFQRLLNETLNWSHDIDLRTKLENHPFLGRLQNAESSAAFNKEVFGREVLGADRDDVVNAYKHITDTIKTLYASFQKSEYSPKDKIKEEAEKIRKAREAKNKAIAEKRAASRKLAEIKAKEAAKNRAEAELRAKQEAEVLAAKQKAEADAKRAEEEAKIAAKEKAEAERRQAELTRDVSKDIGVSFLRGGFDSKDYHPAVFDPRTGSIFRSVRHHESFAPTVVKNKGKNYLVIGLAVNKRDISDRDARGWNDVGERNGFAFASIEITDNLPINVGLQLFNKAKAQLESIYPSIKGKDVIINEKAILDEVSNFGKPNTGGTLRTRSEVVRSAEKAKLTKGSLTPNFNTMTLQDNDNFGEDIDYYPVTDAKTTVTSSSGGVKVVRVGDITVTAQPSNVQKGKTVLAFQFWSHGTAQDGTKTLVGSPREAASSFAMVVDTPNLSDKNVLAFATVFDNALSTLGIRFKDVSGRGSFTKSYDLQAMFDNKEKIESRIVNSWNAHNDKLIANYTSVTEGDIPELKMNTVSFNDIQIPEEAKVVVSSNTGIDILYSYRRGGWRFKDSKGLWTLETAKKQKELTIKWANGNSTLVSDVENYNLNSFELDKKTQTVVEQIINKPCQ
jgi:hypothetical protein